MKEILIVIDMQNDFLTGSLGNKECAATADVTPAMKVHALAVLGSIQCDVA